MSHRDVINEYVKRFSEKHRLQLLAIRLYQALGLPLRRIREELYGRNEADLRDLVRRGRPPSLPEAPVFLPEPVQESWGVMALSEDFMLVSRRGCFLPPGVLDRLREVLRISPNPNRVDSTPGKE